MLNFTDICVFYITKLLDMKFPFFKIIFICVFGSIILFDGCKSSVVSPDACVKVVETLSAATKTYDTTSTLAMDTLRKRASCIAYGLALQNFIKVSYANGCITASDTINYKRMLANVRCK